MNPRWFTHYCFQNNHVRPLCHHTILFPFLFVPCSLFSLFLTSPFSLCLPFLSPSFSLCLPFLFPPAFSPPYPGVPLLGGSPAWGSPCFPYVIIGTVTSIRICGYIIIVNIIYVVIPNTIAAPCPTFPVFTVISALSLKYIYLIILI